MTSPNFDLDSQLHSLDDEKVDDLTRVWHGQLTSNWSIGPVPNGGYSSAVALRALLAHTGCNSPWALTTHYYRPTIGDAAVEVRTEVLRRGRTTTHADAVLIQDDKIRLRCVGVFGDIPAGEVLFGSTPPPIPDPQDCLERDPAAQGLDMSLLQSLEVRLHQQTARPIDTSTVQVDGWVRFRDGRPNDALALCLFADTFPPAIVSVLPETGWVPTIEMTTHIRAAAAPGWIRGQITTTNVHDGYLVEDVRLWDSNDVLVVDARQLAMLRA